MGLGMETLPIYTHQKPISSDTELVQVVDCPWLSFYLFIFWLPTFDNSATCKWSKGEKEVIKFQLVF